MEKTQGGRNLNFDLMRSVSAFAVVWLHVAAQFATSNPDIHSYNWWVANIADAFSRWCVPVFVMLSGALLLEPGKYASTPTFYKKRLSRLLKPLAFWTFFYIVFRYLTEPSFSASSIPKNILTGKPYFHLWYLYMVVGLYITTPYFQIITRHTDRTSLLYLTLFLITINCLDFLLGKVHNAFFTNFFSYTGYFLGGYYISNYSPKFGIAKTIAGAISCGILITLFTGYYLPGMGVDAINMMYGYLNPLVIAFSFLVFLTLKNINIENAIAKRFIEFSASLSLGIYLIHPMWLWILNRYIFWRLNELNLVAIPIFSITAFTLSLATAYLFARNRLGQSII